MRASMWNRPSATKTSAATGGDEDEDAAAAAAPFSPSLFSPSPSSSSSACCSLGAVHPRTSPGDRGLDCGTMGLGRNPLRARAAEAAATAGANCTVPAMAIGFLCRRLSFFFFFAKVELHGGDQVVDVAADVHEDVNRRDRRPLDGDEARVAVVDQGVGGGAGERALVVDAAGAVGHVAQDGHADDSGDELLDDVGEREREEQKALWELQRDAFRSLCPQPPDRFRNFEVVVGGQGGHRRRELGVVEDVVGDLFFF